LKFSMEVQEQHEESCKGKGKEEKEIGKRIGHI
jgi:hypothetical protein